VAREQRLIVEVDGYSYHRGRQAMRDDNDRDLELELLGFRVIRIDDSRITDDPAGVVAAVLGLLGVAS
jgi:very-short-patch-repair endonuclease